MGYKNRLKLLGRKKSNIFYKARVVQNQAATKSKRILRCGRASLAGRTLRVGVIRGICENPKAFTFVSDTTLCECKKSVIV